MNYQASKREGRLFDFYFSGKKKENTTVALVEEIPLIQMTRRLSRYRLVRVNGSRYHYYKF